MNTMVKGNIYWYKKQALQFAIVDRIDETGLIWAWVYRKTPTTEAISYEDIDIVSDYVYSGMQSASTIWVFDSMRKIAELVKGVV